MIPEKTWSISSYLTRHLRLITPLLCCFLYSVFVLMTRIGFLLFPLLMFLLYGIKNRNVPRMPRLNTISDNCFPSFNLRHNYLVPTICVISLISLFQSTLLVCFTLLHKTAIVGWLSGIAIFHKNKSLAIFVWENSALLLFRGLLPSTLNRFLVAGLVTAWYFLIFTVNSSNLFSHSFVYQFLLLLL